MTRPTHTLCLEDARRSISFGITMLLIELKMNA